MNDERWLAREAQFQARISRRQTLIGGALLATAVAGLALKPRRSENLLGAARLEDLVPKQIGDWQYFTASGLVLPPADQLRDEIYSQILTRTYVRDGDTSVMLLIAYSGAQDGTISVHRPEVCYPAGGFRLSHLEPHVFPLAPGVTVPGRAIIADNDVRHEQLLYWTRLGNHFPDRWSEQHLAVAAENFSGIIPDGVLVRLSSVGTGNRFPMLDGFAQELFRSVGPLMRRVLLGPTAG